MMSEKTRNQEELFIQLLEKADNLLTHLGGLQFNRRARCLTPNLTTISLFGGEHRMGRDI